VWSDFTEARLSDSATLDATISSERWTLAVTFSSSPEEVFFASNVILSTTAPCTVAWRVAVRIGVEHALDEVALGIQRCVRRRPASVKSNVDSLTTLFASSASCSTSVGRSRSSYEAVETVPSAANVPTWRGAEPLHYSTFGGRIRERANKLLNVNNLRTLENKRSSDPTQLASVKERRCDPTRRPPLHRRHPSRFHPLNVAGMTTT
jgi:hypothetical protein